jgi:hypothetical protein
MTEIDEKDVIVIIFIFNQTTLSFYFYIAISPISYVNQAPLKIKEAMI